MIWEIRERLTSTQEQTLGDSRLAPNTGSSPTPSVFKTNSRSTPNQGSAVVSGLMILFTGLSRGICGKGACKEVLLELGYRLLPKCSAMSCHRVFSGIEAVLQVDKPMSSFPSCTHRDPASGNPVRKRVFV